MKTLRKIFGIEEPKKSLSNFLTQLDLNAMLRIKGGDEDDDLWPPPTGGGG